MKEKILAIDANPFVLSIIKSTLESAGYKVFTALDGESGLEQFHYRRPDLVVMDVMLPHLNGWDVCRRIRKLSNVPIIIHTTVDSPEELSQAAKVGACNYLVKPVLPKLLRSHVDAILKSQEVTEQPSSWRSRILPLPEMPRLEFA